MNDRRVSRLRGRAPGTILVALSEELRDREAAVAPHDDAALEAGSLLARGFRCPCETVHVPCGSGDARPPDEALLDAIGRRDDPLLVLGARSRFPAAGRTTRGVVTFLTCPVWIQRGPWTAPRRVLAAIAYPLGDRDVLRVGVAVSAMLGARLDVAHCRESATPGVGSIARSDLDALVDSVSQSIDEAGGPEGDVGVLEVAGPAGVALAPHLERADLTILGRGARRGLGRVLHEVIGRRRGPFVVVPPTPRPGYARHSAFENGKTSGVASSR